VVIRARHSRALIERQLRGGPDTACTRDTLRCQDARSYRAELRPCCRAHLRQLVADVVDLLTARAIPYWADYGTLLGAVRNPLTTWADFPWLPQRGRAGEPLAPGILPHDKDADFGALFEDWHRLLRLVPLLEARGYFVHVNAGGAKLKVRLSDINYTNLDIFTWRPRVGGLLHRPTYLPVDQYKGRDFPASMLLPLSTVEWEGLQLSAPADPAAFCAFRYGPAWRTPIPANHDGVRRK
jgi:hypothetical protein